MAKKTSLEADLERLKKKVREQRKTGQNDTIDPKQRALRKRLKRAQRKRRRAGPSARERRCDPGIVPKLCATLRLAARFSAIIRRRFTSAGGRSNAPPG